MSARQRAQHVRWDDMPMEQVKEGLGRPRGDRRAHDARALVHDQGSVVPLHSHDNEQIAHVLDGALKLWLGRTRARK